MLAKYRLMEEGLDALHSNDPRKRAFRFIIAEVTEYGHVSMKWNYLDWKCNEEAITERLNASSASQHDSESVLPKQIRELKRINDPRDVESEARAMITELESSEAAGDETMWYYFLCNGKKGSWRIEDQHWTPLSQVGDFNKTKWLARERSQFPVFMRVSLVDPYLKMPWHFECLYNLLPADWRPRCGNYAFTMSAPGSVSYRSANFSTTISLTMRPSRQTQSPGHISMISTIL